LVLAASTAAEVGAARLHALGRRCKHTVQRGAGKSWAALRKRGLDVFSRNDERQEDSFAGTAGVSGKASETVAAINEFLNV
jgi:hypothetical protein